MDRTEEVRLTGVSTLKSGSTNRQGIAHKDEPSELDPIEFIRRVNDLNNIPSAPVKPTEIKSQPVTITGPENQRPLQK